MRSRALPLAASAAVLLLGCAPRVLRPTPLAEPRDPAPLLERLEAYNQGVPAVRIAGTLKSRSRGSADFGATVIEGAGLRFDAVAGPFSTPVMVVACLTGERCQAYVPSRHRVYVDPRGEWEETLGRLIRGRVPVLGREGEGWETDQGSPVLILRGEDGWMERVEFEAAGRLPGRVFLGRAGEEPQVRIAFGEFTEEPLGQPFPTRIDVQLGNPGEAYQILVRRIEPASAADARVFMLSVPPGTETEIARGPIDWKENGAPLWLPLGSNRTSTSP